jgi:hypothetical protein
MKIYAFLVAVLLGSAISGNEARAFPALTAEAAIAPSGIVKVRHRTRHSNWCAYNCYYVPRSYRGQVLGRYGYSRYAYDEDIGFRYRWDRDARPPENVLSHVYPVTGEPVMRLFEREY